MLINSDLQVTDCEFPFTPVPIEQSVLSLLPPFKVPPIVLFGTRGYWLAVGESAKTLVNALGCSINRSSVESRSIHWIALERSRIDPTRFKGTPLYGVLPTSVLFVG